MPWTCADGCRSPTWPGLPASDARVAFDAMVDQRLLTLGEETVEVTHEALLRAWPRLREWLEADVEGRKVHHRLEDAAREWEAGGRDPSDLLRGSRLSLTEEWAADHAGRPERAGAGLPDRQPGGSGRRAHRGPRPGRA